jgi:hypothetical protein
MTTHCSASRWWTWCITSSAIQVGTLQRKDIFWAVIWCCCCLFHTFTFTFRLTAFLFDLILICRSGRLSKVVRAFCNLFSVSRVAIRTSAKGLFLQKWTPVKPDFKRQLVRIAFQPRWLLF